MGHRCQPSPQSRHMNRGGFNTNPKTRTGNDELSQASPRRLWVKHSEALMLHDALPGANSSQCVRRSPRHAWSTGCYSRRQIAMAWHPLRSSRVHYWGRLPSTTG